MWSFAFSLFGVQLIHNHHHNNIKQKTKKKKKTRDTNTTFYFNHHQKLDKQRTNAKLRQFVQIESTTLDDE